ncbi:MAG: hypothetical protein AABY00_02065 [Nanoarchaeota archaeon]
MATVTLSIPDDIREKMKQFPEINWSGLVRKTIEEQVKQLVWKQEILKKLKEEDESGFTQWTIEMGRKAKQGRFERELAKLSQQERAEIKKETKK